jgi:serine/threonine protein kinase
LSQSSISSPSGPSVSTAGIPIQAGSAYPRAFGDYLLLTSFGRGGMGEVYLAKKAQIEGIDHLCVLKRLRSDLGEEEEYVRRFIDEARLVVQLNHGNICHVFDVGRVGPDHFLAMEYIPGVNLRTITDRLAKEGEGLAPGLALYLATEVLDALDYAHRFKDQVSGETINLVHRDVSPHNVMVSFEGETKLIDFGLAASELRDEKTESHVVMGKVSYMSPEQARGDEVSGATDQFATAIILYELLSGKRFYGERRLHEIWQIVGVGDYLPDGFDDDIDEALKPLLRRALAGKPSDRFASCEVLRDALSKLLHTEHGGVGKRQLRELVQRICADEQQQHRKVLKTFQDLSSDTVSQSNEATMSFASRPAGGASDSGSLPTGVMRKGDALKVDAFRSETEETATATAFLGPKTTPGSSSVPVVPGPAWARPVVMGLLLTVGVVGGVYLTRHFDDPPPREVIVAERPTPPLNRVTAPGDAVPAGETPAPLGVPTTPGTDGAPVADAPPGDAPPSTDPPPAGATDAPPAAATGGDVQATNDARRRSRRRRRSPAVDPAKVPTAAPTTIDAPSSEPTDPATDAPQSPTAEPPSDDNGPQATPFEVETPPEDQPAATPPPPAPPPPKARTPREIALAMSTDELRGVLRKLERSPHSCVAALGRNGITPAAAGTKLDARSTRVLVANCARQTGQKLQ